MSTPSSSGLLLASGAVGSWNPQRLAPRPRSRQLPATSAALVLLAMVSIVGASLTATRLQSVMPQGAASSPTAHTAVPRSLGALPLGFEANVGQGPADAQFVARGGGYSLSLSATTLALALQGAKGRAGSVVRMHLVGGNAFAAGAGEGASGARVNYLIGRDSATWRTNIATFQQVVYRGVYPGVDVNYHSNQGQLEYDFVVAPGASPSVIRLGFEGARNLHVDQSGALLLTTSVGPLRLQAPTLYQAGSGGRQPVAGGFVLHADGSVGFAVGAYDRTRPLVIDPTVAYSTYQGGSQGYDNGNGVAVDGSGNAYMTGLTDSPDFPVTSGAFDTTWTTREAYVAKYTAAGALVYSTFLGGSNGGIGISVAADSAGDAVVAGDTGSSDFPTTSGAFQPAPVGSGNWGFLTKLNPSGSGLLYSSYVGDQVEGTSDLGGMDGVALDSAGDAYLTTDSYASDYPTTPGAFQTTLKGTSNMVVSKIDMTKAGSAGLVYSTYVGGSGQEIGRGIGVDASGDAVVDGTTTSSDFPVTSGAFQSTNKGNQDLFVFKLNPTGTGLVYATYLGGSGTEGSDASDPGGAAVDAAGDAYVTSGSGSTDFPTTAGAYQTTNKGGGDAVVAKFDPTGHIIYSSYLGGSSDDFGRAIAAGPGGTALVVGDAYSSDFPTASPTQATYGGGRDAFVAELSADGATLLFSSYLGGSNQEGAYSVAAVGGVADVSGVTSSTDFPTVNPAQPAYAGGAQDAFLTSYKLSDLLALTQSASTALASQGQSVTYTMHVANDGSDGNATGVTLTDPLPAGVTYVSATPSQGSCSQSGGTVTCALGAMPANSSATVTITVTAPKASVKLVNTATVSAAQTDPDPFDNSATTIVYVDAADVSITMSAAPQPAAETQPLTYTMGVSNSGPSTATRVTVVDPLPSGFSLTSSSTTQGSCTQSGGTVTCALGSMTNGSAATVKVVGTVTAAGVLVNTATVSAHQSDPDPFNNSATASTPVNGLGCGEVISKSTTLKADIGPCLGNGVIIGSDHITLDLNGHRIFGNASRQDDLAGIRLPVRVGVTIENGSVDSFSEGIFVNSGGGNTIKKMNVHDNIGPPDQNADFGDGILLESSSSNKVLSNTLNHNGTFDNVGIFGLDANFNLVQGNTLTNSISPGVDFGGGEGVGINAFLLLGEPRRGNSVWGNNIISNTITGNQGAGISSVSNVNGKYEHNIIENNGLDPTSVPSNGIGLQNDATATPNTNDLVAYNTILGNGQDGIQVLGTLGNRILNNTTGGNNANGQGYFDLEDTNGNCSSNTWLNNTYGSGGVNPTCLTLTNQGPSAAASAPASSAPRAHVSVRPRRYVPPWKGV